MFFFEMLHQVISVTKHFVAVQTWVVRGYTMLNDIMPSDIVSVRKRLLAKQASVGCFARSCQRIIFNS